MAKRRAGRSAGGVNRSAAIRDLFDLHGGDLPAKDVISALGARGINVSGPHVANVRARYLLNAAQKKGGSEAGSSADSVPATRRGRKPGRKPGRPATESRIDRIERTLLEAKRMVDTVGGISEARRALDLLAKLQR